MARRILYAYELDAEDPMAQSGRPASILKELRRTEDVVNLSPLPTPSKLAYAPLIALARLTGRTYRPDREPTWLRSMAGPIEAELSKGGYDLVFSPGSRAVAMLETDVPFAFCADAPFGALKGFYEDFDKLDARFERQGFESEARAHANCAAAIYPSRWAAEAAIKHHGADPARTHVIPFGANVEGPDPVDVEAIVDARGARPVKVLFVGRDWERKRGGLVLEACRIARDAGLALELHLVGVNDTPEPLPAWASLHGLLDKRKPEERVRLEGLFRDCHVFFTPSQAEAYGMAFCEAAAWATPSLTTAVGGITTIVEDGVTGRTLAPGAAARAYAEALVELVGDPGRYRETALRARADYEARLNWPAFVGSLLRVLASIG